MANVSKGSAHWEGGLTDGDAENEAALAQPAYPDENDMPDEEGAEPTSSGADTADPETKT